MKTSEMAEWLRKESKYAPPLFKNQVYEIADRLEALERVAEAARTLRAMPEDPQPTMVRVLEMIEEHRTNEQALDKALEALDDE